MLHSKCQRRRGRRDLGDWHRTPPGDIWNRTWVAPPLDPCLHLQTAHQFRGDRSDECEGIKSTFLSYVSIVLRDEKADGLMVHLAH